MHVCMCMPAKLHNSEILDFSEKKIGSMIRLEKKKGEELKQNGGRNCDLC